jgi:hypothetical protein
VRTLAIVLALGSWIAAAAPAPKAPDDSWRQSLRTLQEGRYQFGVKGPVCNACTKAIVEEAKAVRGVQDASMDYEEGVLRVTIGTERGVRLSQIERALNRAYRRVRLGPPFELSSGRRLDAPPPPKAPPAPKQGAAKPKKRQPR